MMHTIFVQPRILQAVIMNQEPVMPMLSEQYYGGGEAPMSTLSSQEKIHVCAHWIREEFAAGYRYENLLDVLATDGYQNLGEGSEFELNVNELMQIGSDTKDLAYRQEERDRDEDLWLMEVTEQAKERGRTGAEEDAAEDPRGELTSKICEEVTRA